MLQEGWDPHCVIPESVFLIIVMLSIRKQLLWFYHGSNCRSGPRSASLYFHWCDWTHPIPWLLSSSVDTELFEERDPNWLIWICPDTDKYEIKLINATQPGMFQSGQRGLWTKKEVSLPIKDGSGQTLSQRKHRYYTIQLWAGTFIG